MSANIRYGKGLYKKRFGVPITDIWQVDIGHIEEIIEVKNDL